MMITERIIESIDLGLTLEELEALNTVFTVIDVVQKTFDDNINLRSMDSGEIVNIDELARVKGVIDFFMSHTIFEII